MNKIDALDAQIVRLMGRDARQNSEAVAKQLNLSPATVRRRLRKLIHSNLLSIVGVVDPSRFGFPLLAVISLNVTHNKIKDILEKLSKRPEIRTLATTTGRHDILVMARFSSTERLSEFITDELAKLEGIRDSETSLCLQIKKGFLSPLDEL